MRCYNATTSEAYDDIIDDLKEMPVQESRGGDTRELLGVAVQSEDPKERLFKRPNLNLAFCLQECIAYWNGLNPGHVERYNPNMKNYMTDGELEGSAYGRYFRDIPHDQISRVIDQLRGNQHTRQAVINVHQSDVERYDGPDVACTIYLQFMIRDDELHCFANMRSQDMLFGYPYDVHNFQWLQTVLAGVLDVGVGTFTHYMNSCHYYTEYEDEVLASQVNDKIRIEGGKAENIHEVMPLLMDGLEVARNGGRPINIVRELSTLDDFYADWLRYMCNYESVNFHDGSRDFKPLAEPFDSF